MAPLLILFLLSFVSVAVAEDRPHGLPGSVAEDRPHGLASETPVPITPQADTFFDLQPNTSKPCDSSQCSTLPLAATMQSTPALESQSSTTGSHGLRAGSIAGISLSFIFVALIGMGAYYVVTKRRANIDRAQPEEA